MPVKFLFGENKTENGGMYRVTVVSFEDAGAATDGGRVFAERLGDDSLFEVDFSDTEFPKGFLNLQGRNFFDFIDRGNRILEQNHGDAVIWGYCEGNCVRLNFQTSGQYTAENSSFSLLDSLFLPANYFTSEGIIAPQLMQLIKGIVFAAVSPVTKEQKQHRTDLLKNTVGKLSDAGFEELPPEFMPYVMNMLGKIYLASAEDSLAADDIKITEDLFAGALDGVRRMRLPVYYGCVYSGLGRLYETAFKKEYGFDYLKSAIKYYRRAQKYFKGSYPYDSGLAAYRLSALYFAFWKHTGDLQALRDAVSSLREAEKVYTVHRFPQQWCEVEGLLGYYLTCLGMETKSDDIMRLAVMSYHNRQKIFDQTGHPSEWAGTQEEIGNIYYLLGKQDNDENFMLEAKNYFNSAADVYAQLKDKEAEERTKRRLAAVENYTG